MTVDYQDLDVLFTATDGPKGAAGTGSRATIPAHEVTRALARLDTAQARDEGAICALLAATDWMAELRRWVETARRTARAAGLRVRLRLWFDGCSELDDLPWETLFDVATVDGPAAPPDDLTIQRHIPMAQLPREPLTAPLRILLALANPRDLPPFTPDRERWNLRQSLQPLLAAGVVKLDVLERADLRGLRRSGPSDHDVVHFVGYGKSDLRARYGSLLLIGDGGAARAVTADYLGNLLVHDLAVKLAVLSVGSEEWESHPFGQTARTLIRCGLPAVVAMRRWLRAETAASFFGRFYASFASGQSVDLSVARARGGLAGSVAAGERAAPVLYAPTGGLLCFVAAAGGAAAAATVTGTAHPVTIAAPGPVAIETPFRPVQGLAAGSGSAPGDAPPPMEPPPIDYLDFAVKIEPGIAGSYPVLVLASPAGQGRGRFLAASSPLESAHLLDRLGLAVRATSRMPPGCRELQKEETADLATGPSEVGDQLFEGLFSTPVRSLLDFSMGAIESASPPGRGLRLSLHLAADHPDLAALASLPWELLYWRDRREYLCLSRKCPLVRSLDVPQPARPVCLVPPIRILVAAACPAGYPPLDLSAERLRIEQAWAHSANVEIEMIDRASPSMLRAKLLARTFHALHFMGHGGFTPDGGVGTLLFEREMAQEEPLPGPVLAELLRDFPALQLVMLNCCDSARIGRRRGADPFASVATALVMAGLPAVVAMQFPISDEAAVAFSKGFYQRLAAGDPIDAAMVEGRMAIHLNDPASLEWATPVLFLRGA